MNFKQIFAAILQGAAGGAAQGLEATPAGSGVNWQSVGIVAAFGAIAALSQSLAQHPAVAAAQAATPVATK